ncbi:MAG: hypothetical protein ACTHM8_12210 [Sphingomonas sp.]
MGLKKIGNAIAARSGQIGLIVGSFAGIAGLTAPVHAIGDPCTVARIKCYDWYKDDPDAYATCIEEVENGICDTSGDLNPPPLPPNCGNFNEWPCEI